MLMSLATVCVFMEGEKRQITLSGNAEMKNNDIL